MLEHLALTLKLKLLKIKVLLIRYKGLISKVNQLLDLKNLDIVFNVLHKDRIRV
jgi:hypothetical protein